METVVVLFTLIVFANSINGDTEHKKYMMSLNGPKDGVPVEGVILNGNILKPFQMKSLQNAIDNLRSEIDSKFKLLQETLQEIPDKIKEADASGNGIRKQLNELMVKMNTVIQIANNNGA